MPFTYEINGQDIEFDKEPTEADIDEVAEQLKTGFTTADFPETQTQPQKSDMPFLEKAGLRTKLAFGDKPEYVQQWLQQRYPDREITNVGGRKFAIDGIPIDPGEFGFDELLLDSTVDIADEIIRIMGMTWGATKGATLGTLTAPGVGTVVGGIAGAGVGRAGAQGAVEGIGRAFGVQGGEDIGQIAKDIAREGAIGATAEAGGLALRALSRPTGKFLRNFFNKLANSGRKGEQMLLNFTAGSARESIERLQTKGANILTNENLSDDALLKVGGQIRDAAVKERQRLGQLVESGKGIIKNITTPNIDVTDIRGDFANKLQNAYLLGKNFQPLKPVIGKLDTGQKELIKIFNLLKKTTKISPAQALRWRSEIDRIIKYSQQGKFVITDFENSIMQGLRSQLKQKLIDVSDDFAKANTDFSAFAQIEDVLKGKLDLQRVENFLKGTVSGQHIYQQTLEQLNQKLPIQERFIEKLYDVLAARDFASTTFRGIRTGIISAALGSMGLVAKGPLGAAGGIALGITLSTPRMAGRALLKRQQTFRMMEALMNQARLRTQQATPKVGASLLSQLIPK